MLPTLTLRQVPFLKLAILIMVGIIGVRIGLREVSPLAIYLTLGLIIILLTGQHFSRSGDIRSTCLNIVLTLVGALMLQVHMLQTSGPQEPNPLIAKQSLKLFEVEEFSVSNKYLTLYCQSISTDSSNYNQQAGALLRVKKPTSLSDIVRGDVVATSIKLNEVVSKPLPNGFDYGQYLLDRGYEYQGFVMGDKIKKSNQTIYPWWKYIRYNLRNSSLATIDRYLSGTSNKITKALVLGDRSGLDLETREKYADSGIIHILAVSGLHVGIIAFLLFHFFDKLLWRLSSYAWIKTAFIIMGLIAFAEISGGSPTVWRAVIMSSIFFISKSLRRNAHALNLLGIAAILILLLKPTDLFSVSFQLSFAAVGGILLYSPWFFKLYDPQGVLSKKAWAVIVIGVCAQLGTLPLTLYYFHQIPLLSAVAGLIAIPAAFIILSLGIALILIGSLWKMGGEFISVIIDGTISFLNGTVETINLIPFALIKNIWIQPIQAIIITASFITIAMWLYLQKRALYKYTLTIIAAGILHHTI